MDALIDSELRAVGNYIGRALASIDSGDYHRATQYLEQARASYVVAERLLMHAGTAYSGPCDSEMLDDALRTLERMIEQ